jgi:hypothetical protein
MTTSSENIDVILTSQNKLDKLFAQTTYLKHQVKALKCAKELAGRGNLEFEDIKGLVSCNIASRYVPFVASLHQYTQSNVKGQIGPGAIIDIELKSAGSDFTGDTVLVIEFDSIGNEKEDVFYRLIDYPGIRLIREARFQVNGQTRDKYTYQNVMEIYDHELDANQRIAFDRCVGQQLPKEAKYYNEDEYIRQSTIIYDGLQTYKKFHPAFTLTIPLLFFFRNPATPLNNDYLSDKNRSIQIVIGQQNEIINALDASSNPLTVKPGTISIKRASVLTRNTWMDESLKDLFNHPGKLLIRSWGHQKFQITASGSLTLDAVKFPVDRMYFRFVPEVNRQLDASAGIYRNFSFDSWHIPLFLELRSVLVPHFQRGSGPPTLVARSAIYYKETEPITSVNLQVSQTNFFGSDVPPELLSNYMQFNTNRIASVSRKKGTYMISFEHEALPYSANVAAGYIDFTNLSSKELRWTSELISPTNPVRLEISWRYLNMIWPKGDGTIDFRYVPQFG